MLERILGGTTWGFLLNAHVHQACAKPFIKAHNRWAVVWVVRRLFKRAQRFRTRFNYARSRSLFPGRPMSKQIRSTVWRPGHLILILFLSFGWQNDACAS